MTRNLILYAGCGLLLLSCGCSPYRRERPKPGEYLNATPQQTVDLSDKEYLMRKATLGPRAERMEALDVIERTNDPQLMPFLIERLEKEDDRFLQIKIMHVLADAGDVRAVPPLRKIARWDSSRLGVEAIAALYQLGDDSLMPRLIQMVKPDEENPELAGIAYRALKKMTGAELPAQIRPWMNYYYSHRLAPYQSPAWYWPLQAPLPPTEPGSTTVIAHERGRPQVLPDHDLRVRHTHVTWSEFWKPEEP